jgi:drug/metabolite transporter (DMT)-like permease
MTGRDAATAAEPAAAGPRVGRRWTDGVLPGSVGVLCFSGTAAATRVADPVFGPYAITFARIVIAAVLGAITLTVMGQQRWPGRGQVPGLLVGGLGTAVGYPLFLAIAVGKVPAYHGAVVIGLVPAATAVIAVIRTGERPTLLFWLACLTGLAAVIAFAVVQGGGRLHAADAWLAAAVLSCGLGYVEGAEVSRQIGAIHALCWTMILLAPAAAIGLVVSISVHPFRAAHASAWAALGYVCVISMFAGLLAWYRGLAAGGTSRIGQLNLAQPFLAIAWSGVLLGEQINWTVPATATVILACMTVCLKTT